MKNYHDIKEIKFLGDVLEATIDGDVKRFRFKDVSDAMHQRIRQSGEWVLDN